MGGWLAPDKEIAVSTQVLRLTTLLLLLPVSNGRAADDPARELDEKLRAVNAQIEKIKKRQAAELLELEKQAAELEQEQAVRRGKQLQAERARQEAERKAEAALNKTRYVKVEVRGKSIVTARPLAVGTHIPYQVAVGDQKFTLYFGGNMEALGVATQNAGREIIVTGKMVKVPAPPAPAFPSIEPPTYPHPLVPGSGFNPQLMQEYARKKDQYDETVKAWKILDKMIRDTLGPGFAVPAGMPAIVIPHNDYAIEVENVKPAEK